MNISTPFPSQIRSVDFGFLTRSEIRRLSVKRILHTEAINPELGFPNPGGLYDQALGTREDFPCTTCNLEHLCPGHVGHIELPQPVYHPVFMDQLIKLLNFQCGCCWRFRLGVVELHAFACKLKLLSYGLVKEAHGIDFIDVRKTASKQQTNGLPEGESEEEVDEKDAENVQSALINARNKYLAQAMRESGGKKHLLANQGQKVGVLVEARKSIIKDLFRTLARDKQCQHCNGYSPAYRKDGFNKIFRQPLSEKYRMENIQRGVKPKDPTLERARLRQEARAKRKKQREAEDDEGIAMEVDDFSEEETEGGEDEDVALNSGSLLDTAAATGTAEVKRSSDKKDNQVYITPSMARASLEELFREEREVLGLLYQSRPNKAASQDAGPEMFFLTDILVTPNRFRPEMRQGTGMITEASQNKSYSNILSASIEFNDARRLASGSQQGSPQFQRGIHQMQQSLIKMQDMVNALMDSDKNGSARASVTAPQGVKQLLEKKEGLFRMNMMGKRVNFAARSVISPDPNIEPNEIGVPPVFAKKLTYPEPVTNHNFYEMKQAVLNGPDVWPGAAAIENESGQLVNLKYKNFEERQALANQLLAPSSTNVSGARNKRVHRHLNNGDIVIMNRQPTLHKPSMMCHRARVLPGEKTIRMHYANCNTYNADFDGDEMNMHFPQNEAARAEAILIADTNHQYLSGTAGKPLRGLIQDHLSMSVWLSNKDTFFDRADYHQLLYSCLRPEKTGVNIQTVPPAIVKPRAMWTGKQLVTTILKNIQPPDYPGLTMTGKSSVPEARWQDPDAPKDKLPTEGQVIFKHGDFLCGILDKAQLGPAKGGFIHSVYEVYGETIAGSLLGILGRMLTKLEHMRAFSCGMEDIVLTKSGNQKRRELLAGSAEVGHEVATKYVSLDSSVQRHDHLLMNRLEDVLRDDKKQQGLDTVYNSRTAELSSNITKECLPSGLFKPFPRNQMQTMTVSGAKGSAVNANLISCNLGQQVLEGRRTPTMVSGKTLPAFKPFETAVRAGGYITNRFLTGVQPQEYYFHTMAGREGLIDTAVKTSRSGYLQRCIIKGMEGLQVEYDTTVRDSDGSVVQFLYGEDGLDVTKQVQLSNFKFQAENWGSAAQKYKVMEANPDDWKEDVADANQKAIRKVVKTSNLGASVPVLSDHNPSSVWGATSEKFATALKAYIKQNPDGLIKDKKTGPNGELPKKQFQMLLEMMYMRSVIEPGEPVGIVAGQSIGEPSTQMTLNTFHLAGHSAKNVTLGIPRLREIVMTATANLATPQMRLYFNEEINQTEGETFAKALTKRTIAEVIDDIVVTERVGKGVGFAQAKIYDVRLNFFPAKEYREEYAFTEEELAFAVEAQLIPILERAVRKEIKDKGLAKSGKSKAQPVVGKSYGASESAKVTQEEADGAQKEQDRTDDVLSEESDDDDEDEEDKPDQEANAYGDDEDDRKIAEKAREGSVEPDEGAPKPPHEDEGYGGSPREEDDKSDDEGDQSTTKDFGPGDVSRDMAAQRAERVVSASTNSVFKFKWDVGSGSWCQFSLEYDSSTEKILMLHLVEKACQKAVIQYITNIRSATLDKEKLRDDATGLEKDATVLIVEGNNLSAMHEYQNVVDPHRMFTNDIVAMMNTYGVEAGRATIIREMDAVFKGHSIDVDNRHLNLIADHMTRNGDFLAFSRTGMKSGVSPFAKMSFETTVGFLKDAVMEQDFDDLSGPSARIVTGRVGKVGTGAFDVLTPVSV